MVKMEHTERVDQQDHASRAQIFLDYTSENISRAQTELAEKVTSPFLKSSKGLWDKITTRGSSSGKRGGDESNSGSGSDDQSDDDDNDAEQDGEFQMSPTSSTTSFSSRPTSQVNSPLHPNSPFPTSALSTDNLVMKTPSDRTASFASSGEHSRHSFSDFNPTFNVDAVNLQEQWRGKEKSTSKILEDGDLTPHVSPESSAHHNRGKVTMRESGNKSGIADETGTGGVRGNIKQVVGDVATGLGATIKVFSNQVRCICVFCSNLFY